MKFLEARRERRRIAEALQSIDIEAPQTKVKVTVGMFIVSAILDLSPHLFTHPLTLQKKMAELGYTLSCIDRKRVAIYTKPR